MAAGAKITAEGVLRIPPHEPERLFSGDPAAAKGEYRRLVRDWHPDHSDHPMARDVLERVVALYRTAEARFEAGEWRVPGFADLRRPDGGRYRVRSRRRHDFPTGTLHVGDTAATWVLPEEDADLHGRAVAAIRGLSYPDDRTREVISRHMPEIRGEGATDRGPMLSLRKSPDEVLLLDLLAHMGGRLPAVHAAWCVSRLLHLACYLSWAKLMHGAIGLGTVFVSPKDHAASLLGGWGYSAPFGAPLLAMHPDTHASVPPSAVAARAGDPRIDLECVRTTGRALLGDASGAGLLHDPSLPRPLALWLCQPAGKDATGDYEAWQGVLDASFGPRRFVDLPVRPADVYPEP